MQDYSWLIREQMGDLELEANLEKSSAEGRSVSVQRRWVLDDGDEWMEAAQWIMEQHERLRAILAGPSGRS